jgi:hypothetical protein
VRERLKGEVERLRGEVAALMQAAVNIGTEAMTSAQEDVVIAGSATCCRSAISPATWAIFAVPSTCSSRRRRS